MGNGVLARAASWKEWVGAIGITPSISFQEGIYVADTEDVTYIPHRNTLLGFRAAPSFPFESKIAVALPSRDIHISIGGGVLVPGKMPHTPFSKRTHARRNKISTRKAGESHVRGEKWVWLLVGNNPPTGEEESSLRNRPTVERPGSRRANRLVRQEGS